MSRKALSSGASELVRPRRDIRLGWADIGLSAFLMLVVAVPTLTIEEDWHGRPMIDQPTHLWLVAALLVTGAFLVGGAFAGYRRPHVAVVHATTATAVSVAVLLLGAVVRRYWVAHETLPHAVVRLWVFGVLVCLVLGAVDSQIGSRLAKN